MATGSALAERPVSPSAEAVVDHVEHDPETANDVVVNGPFTERQLTRISEAMEAADRETGLIFSVYIGEFEGETREYAEGLHAQLADPSRAILLAVSPNQRVLEIVTGSRLRRRVPDQVCGLAALSMTSSFSGGDLVGGVVTGIRMLADQARTVPVRTVAIRNP